MIVFVNTPDSLSSGARPRVSIGLPVYNGALHLPEALDSLLSQRFTDFEIILSDNASTDGTEAICRAYAAKDARIRYVRQEENIGPTANFNFVLSQSVAPYFMWAAHDDFWEPDFLGEMVAILDARADVEIAFCKFDNVTYEERLRTRLFDMAELVQPSLYEGLNAFLRHAEYNGKANVFYGLLRRETVLRLGGVKIWGVGVWGADMLYVFSILTHGRLALSERVLFHKRSAPSVVPLVQEGVARLSHRDRLKLELTNRLQECRDWQGYWIGYLRVLRLASRVSLLQRLSLRCIVWKKMLMRLRIQAACQLGLKVPRAYEKWLANKMSRWISA